MLILSEQDIREAVTMKDVIDAIDEAFGIYEENTFTMPTRMHVENQNNMLLLMPCFTDKSIGTKMVTVFPDNTKQPVIQGLVMINDINNGEPKALINGTFLTGLRTGAVGGSGVRHLADPSAQKVALIGTGQQGLYQLIAACTERPITNIYLYNRSLHKIPAFIKSLQKWLNPDITIHTCDHAYQAIEHADIIIAATTSNDPVLPNDPDILKGKLTVGVGSFQPSMREFPEALYQVADRLFIDSDDALKETGDLIDPLENNWTPQSEITRLSQVVTRKRNLSSSEKTLVFKSTGMALFDAVVAQKVLDKSLEKGAGQNIML